MWQANYLGGEYHLIVAVGLSCYDRYERVASASTDPLVDGNRWITWIYRHGFNWCMVGTGGYYPVKLNKTADYRPLSKVRRILGLVATWQKREMEAVHRHSGED